MRWREKKKRRVREWIDDPRIEIKFHWNFDILSVARRQAGSAISFTLHIYGEPAQKGSH